MSKINDGGPAFPHLHDSCQRINETEHHSGLSLRDWFAGQALAGMLALPNDPFYGNFHNNCGEQFIGPAEHAYRMADAMLKAREADNA